MATIPKSTMMKFRTSFALACLLTYASIANAQVNITWKQLGETLPTRMRCAYFFDTAHGVVAGVGAIWVYQNGFWSNPSTIPSGAVSYFTSVNELKPGVLYATSGDTDVWVSNDSGETWQNTSTAGELAKSAYFTKDGVLHSTVLGTFARLDSNICILTDDNGSAPSYSTDGGETWTKSSTSYIIGGLGAFADTCRKMFFVSAKDSSTAYYSLDSGRTWHPTGPYLHEDILNGADGSVYHQDSTGVWCSVDAGTSWQFLQGPKATTDDYSMFGFGPYGNWIVAMTGGEVWLYSAVEELRPADPITRGDTDENCPISRIPVIVRPFTRPYYITMTMNTDGPQSLSPTDTSFTIQPGVPVTVWYTVSPTIAETPTFGTLYTTANDGCREFAWTDDFTIVTVPLPIATPDIQMQNCEIAKIPLSINSQNPLRMYVTASADSGWSVLPADTSINLVAGLEGTLTLTPTAPSLPIGTLIHLSAWDTVACTIYHWDTVFTISVVPVPVAWKWVDSVAVNACDSVRIPISFDLASCDSLSIDTFTIIPSDSLLNFESNPKLTRGASDTLWLTYAPHGRNAATKYSLGIQSHFVPEHTPLDTTLSLHAIASGSPDPHASAPNAVALNSCDPTPFSVFVKAAGCENVRIDSMQFLAPGIIVTGGPATADTVLAGETDTLHYTIEALSQGTRDLDIYFYLYRLANQVEFDTAFPISLEVSGAEAQPLISTEPKLDLSNCTTSIVPFFLNAPCDSMTVTACNITVPNGLNYTSNLTFPLKLGAETSDSLLLSFAPQGLNQTAMILAEIKGTYGGTKTTFDTTAQTQVTFSCANSVSPLSAGGSPIVLAGLQVTSDQLQFGITKNDDNITGCQAEILSILGDIMAQQTFPLPSTQNALSWDLNALPSGEYYLRITSGDDRITGRFVLIK
jgi:hypothetical protein